MPFPDSCCGKICTHSRCSNKEHPVIESDKITWVSTTYNWTWPLAEEQKQQLSVVASSTGDIVPVYVAGPAAPFLIGIPGPGWEANFENMKPGESLYIRFGQIDINEIARLTAHPGWHSNP
jgi:hypothetical protein